MRETCETHVLRTASLSNYHFMESLLGGRLAGALGAKSTSLEVYHYLSLRATLPCRSGRLDDALRRCVSLHWDRLENEPLLADGRRPGIGTVPAGRPSRTRASSELLQGQVRHALAAEEAHLALRSEMAYETIYDDILRVAFP